MYKKNSRASPYQRESSDAKNADFERGATLLSGHEEDLPGSLEVFVVLVGEQLVDLLLPIIIVGRDVFRGRCGALLLAAAARYNLVIL